MRIVKEEKGQILVFTALSMAVLLGFVGLATDVGQLFHVKRHLQTVADAAATAGALYDSYGVSAVTAGQAAAKANGVTDGVSGATVTINEPPLNGPNVGEAGFVEAIVSVPNNTFFMGLFGTPTVSVTARAVAGPGPGKACIYLMNSSGTDFSLQGSGTVEAPGGGTTCGVYSNSTSTASVTVNGNANDINTSYVGTMGGLSSSGNANTTPTPTTTNVPQQNPPDSMDLSSSLPSLSSFAKCITPSGGKPLVNISGSKYVDLLQSDLPSSIPSTGICISGNVVLEGTSADPGGTLKLPAGLYVFTGQVGIGNNVDGSAGITLDINGDGNPPSENILTVMSTTNVKLTAPPRDPPPGNPELGCTATGGACWGILFAAPPSNDETFNIQWGSSGNASTCLTVNQSDASDLHFDGLIDAPGVNVSLQDEGGYALVTGMVVGSLELKTGLLCVDNYAEAHRYSLLTSISLVE